MEPVEPRRESAFTVVQFSHAFTILRASVANPEENLHRKKGSAIALPFSSKEPLNLYVYTIPPAA